MGITNKTLIDITDTIAQNINGVPSDMAHRPYKNEIIKAVNMAENSIIIDKPQYDFLRKTAVIKAWKKGTGQTVTQLSGKSGVKAAHNLTPDRTAGAVTYIAQKYKAPASQVLTPANIRVTFNCYTSAGQLNGQFDAFICRGVSKNTLDPTQNLS